MNSTSQCVQGLTSAPYCAMELIVLCFPQVPLHLYFSVLVDQVPVQEQPAPPQLRLVNKARRIALR